MKRFDLIIFDCDGVLVDSEILASQVDAALLRANGVNLKPSETTARYAGLSYADMIASVNNEFRTTIPAFEFERDATAGLARALEAELKPISGIRRLLDSLSGPMCVASSSPLTKLRRSLTVTGLLEYFDPHVYSTENVPRGKPAPDIIHYCCRTMDIPPERTAVVEDSVHGIRAARSAGATAVAFLAGQHCTAESATALADAGAQLIAETSEELAVILSRGLNQRCEQSYGRQTKCDS